MAIVTAIKEKTQSHTAIKKVMDYVAQESKSQSTALDKIQRLIDKDTSQVS